MVKPLLVDIIAFNVLLASTPNFKKQSTFNYDKRAKGIPKIKISSREDLSHSLQLADKGLIGQFMDLWSSPRVVKSWIEKKWEPLIKGEAVYSFCGKGFYNFYFENGLDRDLVFKSGPYFIGAHGLYLDHWIPSFNL